MHDILPNGTAVRYVGHADPAQFPCDRIHPFLKGQIGRIRQLFYDTTPEVCAGRYRHALSRLYLIDFEELTTTYFCCELEIEPVD
jgi:hypothetical protein